MSAKLTVIAQYGTPEEMHLLRNRLEEAGIRVFLENETTAAWAWHFSNALGGVKLLVPEESVSAAREILADRQRDRAAGVAAAAEEAPAWDKASASWKCPNCRAEVDVNMDVCWACGTTIEGEGPPEFPEEEAPETEPEEPEAPPPDVAFLTILFPPTFAYFLFTKLCHALAPLVPDTKRRAASEVPATVETRATEAGDALSRAGDHAEPSREQPGRRSESDLDTLVLRAWRAAWMGLFLLPPFLMTAYSTWLMVEYWFRRRRPDRSRDRRALWTLVVNVVAALCLVCFLWLAIGSLNDGPRDEPGMGPTEEERVPYLGH